MPSAQSATQLTTDPAKSNLKNCIPLAQLKIVTQKIGEGGEAIIHVVEIKGEKEVFKQFRKPSDTLYTKEEGQLAKLRIAEYAQKLNEFPKLSQRIIAPKSIILEQDGSVAGYTMEFINRSTPLSKILHRDDRSKTGYSINQVVELFLDLHTVIKDLHAKGVVIGDFRPENVLCRSAATYIIDTESMQFGRWKNHTFSEDWTDPRLCAKAKDGSIERVKDADFASDWYAFSAMLFTALTGSSPYGGIFIQAGKLVKDADRVLKRLSVLNKGAMLSSSVVNLESIHPALLKEFHNIFGGNDKRGEFPRELLEMLTVVECPKCKKDYSAMKCPCGCSQQHKPGRIEFAPTTVNVEFPAYGEILDSRLHGNNFHSLQYSHLDKKLVRGNGEIVGELSSTGAYDNYFAFGDVQGLLKNHQLLLIRGQSIQKISLQDSATNFSNLVAGNDRTIYAVTKDGLQVFQLKSNITSSLVKSKSKIQGVTASEDKAVTIVQSSKGELYFCVLEGNKLEEILEMPSITGTLIDQHMAASGDSCWIHMNVNDLGSNFNYVFALNLKTKKVLGWTKAADSIAFNSKSSFDLITIKGRDCFFSTSAATPNGFTRIGTKILPAHLRIGTSSRNAVKLVSAEQIVAFDPVATDILASELPETPPAVPAVESISSIPPIPVDSMNPSSTPPSPLSSQMRTTFDDSTPVYGGTLNTACWLHHEAVANGTPMTGFVILRNKSSGDSKYRVLHVADWLRSTSPAFDNEVFTAKFADDRCSDQPVELFAKITVSPQGRVDYEVGRNMNPHEKEALEAYIKAAKNEIAGSSPTNLDIRGAVQRQDKVTFN